MRAILPTDALRGAELVRWLDLRFGSCDIKELLSAMIGQVFRGRIAVASSFGVEAAVLLDLIARTDPATPVIFLDTGMLFPETLSYRDQLVAHLGLSDVRSVTPDAGALAQYDPDGDLHRGDVNSRCHLRKVLPLEKALAGIDCWITGRKRMHGAERSKLPAIEHERNRIKINPLAEWSAERIQAAFAERRLPRHPLAGDGYASIGCHACTRRTLAGEKARDGRWAGQAKTECGIHRAPWYGQNI